MVVLGSIVGPLIFTGYEACATMAEETENASMVAPNEMVKSVFFSGIAGFFMITSLIYACRNDANAILAGPTSQPVVNVFGLVF